MNKTLRTILLCGLVAAAMITGSYAACYFQFWEPQCAFPGNCYAPCTPEGCSQSTCLIATSTGFELEQFNTYAAVDGTYSLRYWDGYSYNTCVVSDCRVWNNCTQRYEYSPISGCSCNAGMKRYWPLQVGCE